MGSLLLSIVSLLPVAQSRQYDGMGTLLLHYLCSPWSLVSTVGRNGYTLLFSIVSLLPGAKAGHGRKKMVDCCSIIFLLPGATHQVSG